MKKPCLVCHVLTTNSSRCDVHQAENEAMRDVRRGNSAKRGYDRQMRNLNKKILARDNYICGYCGNKATGVDHIIPLSTAPHLRLEETNLIACCVTCNSRKKDKLPNIFF